jgi:hypothetical protein
MYRSLNRNHHLVQSKLDRKKFEGCSFYSIQMNTTCTSMQGLEQNYTIFDFDLHSVLEFTNFQGRSISELDENLESVVDTGRSLKFQFFGGGTLTIEGLSGYEDFTSLAMDYMVILRRKRKQ